MEFRVLGPVGAYEHGRPVTIGGTKARAVLAVLLAHRNEPVSVERLAMAIWGDDVSEPAVNRVQQHVSRLRRALGDTSALETTPEGYRLLVRDGELDAERFEALAAEGRDALAAGRPGEAARLLREAEALWRGPALAGLGGFPFAPAEIARLEERRLEAVELRLDADLAGGGHGAIAAELQALVRAHPLRERFHAQLMLALYRSGRQADALAAYTQARDVLVEQLGMEPGAELRGLQQAVLRHEPALEPRAAGTPLPAPATELFGREDELERLVTQIRRPELRLITLIGPGGVGKTRLALEAARLAAGAFPGGARFVELASVGDAGELAPAIARALGVPVKPGEPAADALERFLHDPRTLLVLDNFEQLLGGAPLVGRLVAACPQLTVAITSREPTRLAAERLHPVAPLDVPGDGVDAAQLARYGAVAMFCDRARARDPAFAVDERNAPHVGEICRRLDGLPLALELAAARIGLLSPGELADRLERALDVLSAGASDAPERHRTLRATIDWSYRLLGAGERQALTRMAAFAGDATVAAAEAVTHAGLDTLDSLVAKQLLVRRARGLGMLATVRDYARERLDEDPGRTAVHERLAAWTLGELRAAMPRLAGRGRAAALARLDGELPNALAALAWALGAGRAPLALELAGELGEFWWRANRWRDGERWLDAALEAAVDASDQTRAKALLNRARLHGVRRAVTEHADLETALALYRRCGDEAGAAACLGHLAVAEAWAGRFPHARALSDEAARAARASGDELAVAVALATAVLVSADYADATGHAPAAIEQLARVDSLFDLALACNVTGYLAIAAGRHREALGWLEQGLAAARGLGSPHAVYLLCGNVGLAELFLGDLDAASAAFRDALAVCREAADEELIDETLLGVAAVAVRRDELGRAARLVGAARAHRTEQSTPDEQEMVGRLLGQILPRGRVRAGPEAWDRAEREGAQLNVQEAIELARLE
jgi:predicted ATPase/DNA-binding SARP family transcriptional activator